MQRLYNIPNDTKLELVDEYELGQEEDVPMSMAADAKVTDRAMISEATSLKSQVGIAIYLRDQQLSRTATEWRKRKLQTLQREERQVRGTQLSRTGADPSIHRIQPVASASTLSVKVDHLEECQVRAQLLIKYSTLTFASENYGALCF